METVALPERYPEAWREATRHPFLDAVREGTLSIGAFEAWLTQDYLFVADLLAFQARLLARAPRRDQALLVNGLVAVEAELGWFEDQAGEHGLVLSASRHPTTKEYGDYLTELENDPYSVQITALWALELAYLESWRSAAPGYADYSKFVEHWTAPEFMEYVTNLGRSAAAASAGANEAERVEAAFLEVARLEKDFWEMAWSMRGLEA